MELKYTCIVTACTILNILKLSEFAEEEAFSFYRIQALKLERLWKWNKTRIRWRHLLSIGGIAGWPGKEKPGASPGDLRKSRVRLDNHRDKSPKQGTDWANAAECHRREMNCRSHLHWLFSVVHGHSTHLLRLEILTLESSSTPLHCRVQEAKGDKTEPQHGVVIAPWGCLGG